MSLMVKLSDRHLNEVVEPPHHWRYKPSSLLTILRFYGDKFVRLMRGIEYIRTLVEYGGRVESGDAVPLEAINLMLPSYQEIKQYCNELGLHDTGEYIGRLIKELHSPQNVGAYSRSIIELQTHLAQELSHHVFLRMESPQYYGKSPQFAQLVTEIYPEVAYDVVEAGNCLAMDRGTACVFHLTRIMEFGLQKIGQRLKIEKMQNKSWQQVLNHISTSVSRMPESTPVLRKKKESYNEMIALFEAVKTAWGDAEIEPKPVYSTKEAETLLCAVNKFMVQVASVLNPKAFKISVAKTRNTSAEGLSARQGSFQLKHVTACNTQL